jgi:hypothetical protein
MISMTPNEITRRLREASAKSDLTTERLETKIDMTPAGVSIRLREASELHDACVKLRAR